MNNRSNRNEYRRPYSSRGSHSFRNESRWNDRDRDRSRNFSSYNEDEGARDYNMENSARYSQDRESDSVANFSGNSGDYSRQNYSDRDYRGSQRYSGRTNHLREDNYGSGGFEGRGPKSYVRSDERIREDICEMLIRHPEIDAHDIEVEVRNGEVTLSGTVPERRMKHMAEDLAEHAYSVKDLTNNIRVQRDSSNDWTASSSDQSEMGTDPDERPDTRGKRPGRNTESH